jgi:Kef-type K+ transport system membrane component KefB
LAGLATIIGAFAAGLILEHFFDKELQGSSLRDMLSPLESLIVPIFFVLMGLEVKLKTFNNSNVALLDLALTLAAIAAKLFSGLLVRRTFNRLAIGIGMMPRGQVVNDSVFVSVVIMVIVTTLLTPPLLKLTFTQSSPADFWVSA